ncbi:MAG: hypothetical protein ACRC2T_20120 [Thermoguttaceae bacterium]
MSNILSSNYWNTSSAYQPSAVNKNSQPEPASEITRTDSLGDMVTLSVEALAAYQNTGKNGPVDLNSWQPQNLGELRTWDTIAATSKHHSPIAWALRINNNDPSGASLYSTKSVELIREKVRATAESLDSKISSILKTNKIVLDTNETLHFKVNLDGTITVGDGGLEF